MELVGQPKGPGEPQSDKECEKCIYFDRSLVSAPCHDCYVSADKPDWSDDETGNDEQREMGREDFRVSTRVV